MKNNEREAYKIFKEVFSDQLDEDVFHHKHFNNPYASKYPIDIYYEHEKAVGINAFMGAYLLYNGKKIYILQSNDTAVLPESRGKGIFTKIVSERDRLDDEASFIMGIPNANSYPGFMKMRFQQCANLTHYVRFTHPWNLLLGKRKMIQESKYSHDLNGKKLLLKISRSFEFHSINWENVRKSKYIGFFHDEPYMRWKLGLKNNLYYVTLGMDDQIFAYIIVEGMERAKGLSAYVHDYYSENQNPYYLKKCFDYIGHYVDMIDIPYVNVNSNDARILGKAGCFDYRKINRKYHPDPLIISSRCKIPMGGCCVKSIDVDVFLNSR